MNAQVAKKFSHYPAHVSQALQQLRQLIINTAAELDDVGEVEESLKWGEPSYSTKKGSPIRIDWKESNPQQVALYFNCQSALVETFRELHGDKFRFEGNRALVFETGDKLPLEELKQCIGLALRYHRIKHLPMLGA